MEKTGERQKRMACYVTLSQQHDNITVKLQSGQRKAALGIEYSVLRTINQIHSMQTTQYTPYFVIGRSGSRYKDCVSS